MKDASPRSLSQPDTTPSRNRATSAEEGRLVLLAWIGVALLAAALSWVFFEPLWLGGGLVGGDLYPYFFPQKTVYAEALREFSIPLWNPYVGHGYPQLAESQTGALYPPHLLAYALWDVNDAYSAVQVAHYVIAFLGMAALARQANIGWGGALLAGLVFTYGWFPARLCLEWAIIGGAWMPWSVWGLWRWRETGNWRYAFVLWGGLTLQLLAGHFVFAFMTQLVVLTWLMALAIQDLRAKSPQSTAIRTALCNGLTGGAILGAAYLAAAVQVLPTWEYKRLSQREQIAGSFDPGYGHLPWWSLKQAVVPWSWYADATDINNFRGPSEPLTNRAEAHLYFGLIPLALAAVGSVWALRRVTAQRRGALPDNAHNREAPVPVLPSEIIVLVWLGIGLLALLHATALCHGLTSRLPGFGYFTGPGRFGAITTMAVAWIAAWTWDRWISGRPLWIATVLGAAIWIVTAVDLMWVDSQVRNVYLVMNAPMSFREESPLKEWAASQSQPPRLFCRGANVATLLDVASTPTYLGLSPSQYQSPDLALPQPFPFDGPPTGQQIDWLRRAGVTHVLAFDPLDKAAWPVSQIATVDDPFLNRVWGRYAGATETPLFWLYELTGSRGRVAWESPHDSATARVVSHRRERVEVEAQHPTGGTLILTELAYPGWRVTVDGQPVEGTVVEGMYRGVPVPAGRHTVVWEYRPAAVRMGAMISVVTLVLAAALGHVRFWHPRLTGRVRR